MKEFIGIGYIILICTFVVLKTSGAVDWDWPTALVPLWVPLAAAAVVRMTSEILQVGKKKP